MLTDRRSRSAPPVLRSILMELWSQWWVGLAHRPDARLLRSQDFIEQILQAHWQGALVALLLLRRGALPVLGQNRPYGFLPRNDGQIAQGFAHLLRIAHDYQLFFHLRGLSPNEIRCQRSRLHRVSKGRETRRKVISVGLVVPSSLRKSFGRAGSLVAAPLREIWVLPGTGPPESTVDPEGDL